MVLKKSKKDNKKKSTIKPSSQELSILNSDIKKEDNEYKNKAEALLFASGKKLDVEFISSVIGVTDKIEVKKALFELKKDYESKNSSLMIVDEGNFWKITVKEKYLSIVRKIVADTELSKSVMETLAVIAWKSPALQSDIIKIRTNKAYDHIDELLDTGFITKDKRGRSFVIKVTNKFYEYFDVEGKEGVRDIFSKIKEKPIQKKVDEFKEAPKETLNGLKVVESKAENTVREAEDEMEKKRLGRFEVYGEDEPKDDDAEESKVNEVKKAVSENKQTEEKISTTNKNNDKELAEKTKKLVKELLEEDKMPKEIKTTIKK